MYTNFVANLFSTTTHPPVMNQSLQQGSRGHLVISIVVFQKLPNNHFNQLQHFCCFVHVAGISCGRDETCVYDNEETKSLL